MRADGDPFCLTVITSDAALAQRVGAAGVDRVGVDTERLNKTARQGHIPNARISDHKLADLAAMKGKVGAAALFARLNPLHPGTAQEIDEALASGAQIVMLPYFRTAQEVEGFVRLVDGRAEVALLLETAPAALRLHDILGVSGVSELMVGLNDMHLSTGLKNQFEVVASDFMTMIADQAHAHDIPFGFGGLGRAMDDGLPINADLVVAQHARLGSTRSWLSRSFLGPDPMSLDLALEVDRLRQRISHWQSQPEHVLLQQRDRLRGVLKLLIAQ